MSQTLARLQTLDFIALWASLPADAQARIGTLAIREEFASQVVQDGGFETTVTHRTIADQIRQATTDALPEAVWSAFPRPASGRP